LRTNQYELDPAFLDQVAAHVARRLGRQATEPEWASLRTLGKMFDHSRVTAWRIITKVNGDVKAEDGVIRRRKLSTRLVVYSVSDYRRAVDRIARQNRRRAA
jgi:hypothetical protein